MSDFLGVVQKSDSDSAYSLAPVSSLSNSNIAMNKTSAIGFNDVVFSNTSETHPTDLDLTCSFRIQNSDCKVHPSDLLGLYRVGWSSVNEYVCIKSMSDAVGVTCTSAGNDTLYSVTFKSKDLPKDEGEFFQFCYISGWGSNSSISSTNSISVISHSEGQVRGTSEPFQFIDDDFEILYESTITSLMTKTPAELLQSEEEFNKSQADLGGQIQVQIGLEDQDLVGTVVGGATDQLKSEGVVCCTLEEGSGKEKVQCDLSGTHFIDGATDDGGQVLVMSEECMECVETKQKVAFLSDQLKALDVEKKGLECKLTEMEVKLQNKDKELIGSKSHVDEMEAALYALSVAKESLAERVVRQDKDRVRLLDQIKRTTEELDQLKASLMEYKKISSCSRNSESGDTIERSTSTAVAAATDTDSDYILKYGNPYEGYMPTSTGCRLFQQMDQFS